MKRIFFLFVISLLCLQTMSAQRGVRSIYRKHKHAGTENVHFMVPRPVFWVASLFPRHRDERKLVRSIRNVRLLVAEGGTDITPSATKKLVVQAEQAGFEPLFFVREGKTRVNIHAKERKGKIRGIFMVVHEEDEFVLISIKTRLKVNDLNGLFERLSKEKKLKNIPMPAGPKKKIDQA